VDERRLGQTRTDGVEGLGGGPGEQRQLDVEELDQLVLEPGTHRCASEVIPVRAEAPPDLGGLDRSAPSPSASGATPTEWSTRST